MPEAKRSPLKALLAASRASPTQETPSIAWNECWKLETADLSHNVHLLWILVAELDAGRCKTIGAHQLGNLLEKLAPLQHRVLLDNVGQHFIQRLKSYGLSSNYLDATSVLSRPLICWFASHGCTGACRKLLDANVNPDMRELDFEAGNPTALLLAARGGYPDCVAALIEGGADPHLTDDFGITPLHAAAGSACSNDSTQAAVLAVLLQHPSAHRMLHKAEATGQSALAYAAAQGFTACIKLLLEGYSPPLRQQMAGKALVSAAEAGCTAAVDALIAAGAGAVSVPNSDGPSALEWAAEEGHIGCIVLMLRSSVKRTDLASALLAAAKHGREHIVHLLAEAGGNVNQPAGTSCTTPLMAAAGGGHHACTQQLLERRADVSYTAPDGTTAIMAAASGGHTQCVSVLIKAGAALDSPDHRGMSAIMLAAAAGHVDVVQCLIRHRAALEKNASQDSSPLLVAAAAGQGHTTQALLAGGALVDAPSSTGETAMIVAATHGHVHCMAVLQVYNAGLDVETDQGETALECAVRARQPGAISILLLHGAKIKADFNLLKVTSAALVQICLRLLCRFSSDILQTLSSSSSMGISGSASTQWEVLQILCDESQLVSLLGTGDFTALPLGPQPRSYEANQSREVHVLLGRTIRSLLRKLLEDTEAMSDEQGCALIQGLDCLARLVKQQPSQRKQNANVQQPCFRDLLHSFSPQLHLLCELASSHLRALCHGVLAHHQSPPLQQLTENPQPTHAPKSQHPGCVVLSTPVPQIRGLNQLGIILSSIQAATQDSPSARVHQIGTDDVMKLMNDLGETRVVTPWVNELVLDACRANAKRACVLWGWSLQVEDFLQGPSWQGLLQGAMQALRAGRHMSMWVPRQDMLEDMCHGYVGGTGFASDISAGLEIQFLNESGIGSGVRRDWLNSMMKSMLDPQTGLFESCDGGRTWQPCPLAKMQEEHLVYFEMLGRAMGLALLHGEVLPGAHFTPNFLKGLLGQPGHLDDLRGNPPVHEFLKQLLAGQFRPEDLCLTFSCGNGLGPEADLVPQGRQIGVTSANWREYYKHMLAFKLHKSIAAEVEAVRRGLQHIVDARTMQLLHRYATPKIMDQLLAGEDCIDIEDWQDNTLYKNCSESEPQIRWLWDLVASYDQSQLQALLAFVTCSPAPPTGGFARLAGFNGGRHLFEVCLLPDQTDSRLPRAATCFNTLYLPRYSSKAVMQQRLAQACSAQLMFHEGAIHEVVPVTSAVATSPRFSGRSHSASWQQEETEFVQALAAQED